MVNASSAPVWLIPDGIVLWQGPNPWTQVMPVPSGRHELMPGDAIELETSQRGARASVFVYASPDPVEGEKPWFLWMEVDPETRSTG